MKKKVLITGTSSGLGLNLCDVFIRNNYEVYGISRSPTPRNINSKVIDISQYERLEQVLLSLTGTHNFEYVFLNAGTLKPIKKARDITTEEFYKSFCINVIASKQILDILLENNRIKNVIAISSGAANKAYDGWLNYCVSKAALKQLVSCYALENKSTHFISLAPGVIKTKMQDYLLEQDPVKFSSLEKFHKLYDYLPGPDIVASQIFDNLEFLNNLESGAFFDLREIK
jgi:benzil reductase ((S)-benzoin forming)